MASLLSYALTNVSDVKESLGIVSSDQSYDNLITRKINQVTRQIEAYCSRRFKSTTYTQEEYNATNTDQIILYQRPVIGAITLEVRDTSLNSADYETIESTLYFVDENAGLINTLFNARGRWSRFLITYTAGYAIIPEDLAEAAATLAAYYTINPDGGDVGIAEKREGQRLIRYSNANLSFKTIMENLGVDEIINSYSNNPVMTDR